MPEENGFNEDTIEILDHNPNTIESPMEQDQPQNNEVIDATENVSNEVGEEQESQTLESDTDNQPTDSDTSEDQSTNNDTSEDQPTNNDTSDSQISEGEFTIEDDQLEAIIHEEFDGLSLNEVKEIIKNSSNTQEAEPQFASEEEEKLFNFIKENNPKDFSQGAMEFYRLQSLDVSSLEKEGKFKDLLFEQYKMENRDVPNDKAKRLFDSEFKAKYPSLSKEPDDLDDDLTEAQELDNIRLELDGKKAGAYINEEKKATLSTKTEQAESQAAEDLQQAKAQWDSNVDKTMEGFEGFEINDGDSKFNFVVENQAEIAEMMKDSSKFWDTLTNENGEIQQSSLQEAFAFMTNKEQLVESLIEHGINIGREMLTDEVNNSSRNDKQTQSQPGGTTAKTSDEAMMEAIMNGQIQNGPKF